MVIVVFFGLHSRCFARYACEAHASPHQADHSDHYHGVNLPYDVSQGENFPQDHHEHDCYCQGMPMANARDQSIRLSAPCLSLLGIRHEREMVPEGPFLSEDKPPLI